MFQTSALWNELLVRFPRRTKHGIQFSRSIWNLENPVLLCFMNKSICDYDCIHKTWQDFISQQWFENPKVYDRDRQTPLRNISQVFRLLCPSPVYTYLKKKKTSSLKIVLNVQHVRQWALANWNWKNSSIWLGNTPWDSDQNFLSC